MSFRFHASALALALLTACTMGSGTSSSSSSSTSGSTASSGMGTTGALGSPCTASTDCSGGLVCQTAVPGGYCTRGCLDDSECNGGVCADLIPGTHACLATCNAMNRCRDGEGYACSLVKPATLACDFPGTVSSSSSRASSGTSAAQSSTSSAASGVDSSGTSAATSLQASSDNGTSSAPLSSSSSEMVLVSSSTSLPGMSSTSLSQASSSSSQMMMASSSSTSMMGGVSMIMGSSSSGPMGSDRTAECAAAMNLPLGTLIGGSTPAMGGGNIEGCDKGFVVGRDAPEQIWVLTIAQAGGLTVRVNSTWDASVYLLAGSSCASSTLWRGDACEDSVVSNSEEVMTVNYIPAGTYYVVVDGYQRGMPQGGTYTIRADVTAGGTCAPDFYDQGTVGNNTPATAGFSPQISSDYFTLCGMDEDWFSFSTGGGDVVIRAAAQPAPGGTLLVDFFTLTGSGTATTSAPYTTGISATSTDYTLSNPPAGRYGVRLRGQNLTQAGLTYEFQVRLECTPDLYENDDTPQTAQWLVNHSGNTQRTPRSACRANPDHMLIPAPSTGPASIVIENGAGLDVTVSSVVINDGPVLGTITPNPMEAGVTTSGNNKVIAWNAVVGHVLLVKAQSQSSSTSSNYSVVTTFSAPPNDACNTATTITLPTPGEELIIPFTTVGRGDSIETGDFFCTFAYPPADNGPHPDVFFTFVTPNPGVKIDIVAPTLPSPQDTSSNHLLYLLQGSCSGTESECNADGIAPSNALPANTRYELVVDSRNMTGRAGILSVRTAR